MIDQEHCGYSSLQLTSLAQYISFCLYARAVQLAFEHDVDDRSRVANLVNAYFAYNGDVVVTGNLEIRYVPKKVRRTLNKSNSVLYVDSTLQVAIMVNQTSHSASCTGQDPSCCI